MPGPMSDEGPWYTFPIGNAGLGYWLIGKNPHAPDKWYLMMVGHRQDLIGQYDSPHEAAFRVATFSTGNQMWDSLSDSAFSSMARGVQTSDLDVLKLGWTRHDEYPRPIAFEDEDAEDEDEEDDPAEGS